MSRFLKLNAPWVYSNELEKVDTKIPPGSWVSLEGPSGHVLAYGHFNPHSLIAFRAFERLPFQSEEQTKLVFFKKLDAAYRLRTRVYSNDISNSEMGRHSFRLAFGESDGLPGFIIDLFEASASGLAVLQCHSAGADHFIEWAQEWLLKNLKIDKGIIKNDLDVRRKEHVELYVSEWGVIPSDVFVLEGGVRFHVDVKKGQKTGYFYDHRDNRGVFARYAAKEVATVLDCFSYVGSWGLQVLKKNPKAKLLAVDISRTALDALALNAQENGFAGRVECLEIDFFKEKSALVGKNFDAIICDPPSITSSAKQSAEGRRVHEACFTNALRHLGPSGLIAFASCSFHLTWDDFLTCVASASQATGKDLVFLNTSGQSADHPILSSLPETRYLKSVITSAGV